MKTAEEIKKGMECCAKGNSCRGHCPYDGRSAGIKECTSQLARDALTLIPRWISVEERLPEENGEYLVCYKMIGYKHKLVRVRQYECGFGFWEMTPPSEGFDQVMVEGVTHWMPLPKLPEVTKT